MSHFEAKLQALEAKERQTIEALAAKGIAPCPREGVWLVGVPGVFFVACREIDENNVGIRLCVDTRAAQKQRAGTTYVWGSAWPEQDQTLDTTRLLEGLCAAWPVIARPFPYGLPPYQNGPRESADLATLIGVDGLPPLVFVAEGPALAIECQSVRFALGAESLIVVECLLTLGDLLADRVRGTAVGNAWVEKRGLADVFPLRPELAPENAQLDISREAELTFYAKKYGTDCESLRRWGLRHIANWYLNDQYNALPDYLTTIPSREEVSPCMEKLGKRMGRTVQETIESAEIEFLIECRNHFYYRRWPS